MSLQLTLSIIVTGMAKFWRGFFLLQIYVFDSKYNNLAAFSVSEVASQPGQGGADVLIEEAIPVDNNVS